MLRRILVVALICCLIPIASWADPAYIQSNAAYTSSGTSYGLAYSSNVTAGSLLVSCIHAGAGITSVTDTLGNSWAAATNLTDNSTYSLAMFYAYSPSGGANTVTVNFTGSVGYAHQVIGEWSGVASSSPLDKSTGQFQATPGTGSNAVTSGTVTTTTNGQLIVGCANSDPYVSGQLSAGTGFDIRQQLFGDHPMEDDVQATAGNIAATFTTNQAGGSYTTLVGTFKAAVLDAPYYGGKLRGAY